jgi:hypothetical protein
MNILVDHHHGALLRSMYYLFKKRLNHKVYIPTGFEWLDYDQLYSCYPHRETANQMLNSWVCDSKFESMFSEMRLDEFINTDIDIIVASLFENYILFDRIIKKYNKKCKLILQVGNNVQSDLINQVGVKNLLSSAYPPYVSTNIHKIFYHQEFNTDYFKPSLNYNIKSVANFKHIMEEDFEMILSLEKKLPDWEFKCYGALNRDGIIHDTEIDMAESINKFGFIFHVKKDEGYGHVIHNSFACAKPMIVNLKTAGIYNQGTYIRNTASFLYEKDFTVIDSSDGIEKVSDKLKMMADNYEFYRNNVYKKFQEVVSFENETLEINKFLENLI